MATIAGIETGLNLPSIGGLGGSLSTTMINWIIVFLVVSITLGTLIYFIYKHKVYTKKGFFYERINGLRPTMLNVKPIPLRVVRIGMNEGELLWCKRFGYLPADGPQMGPNTYDFEKNPKTGYFEPFYLADRDMQTGAVDIEYVSTEFKGIFNLARRATEARHKGKKGDLSKILSYGLAFLLVVATLVWSYYTYKQNKDFDAQSESNQIKRLELETQISENFKVATQELKQLREDSGLRPAPGG